ncbi:PAS domain-containing protein [Paralimibaculum aggregatum]|nr:PAS domain-containing protein [Limibaculum sp. NKW23]
MIHPEIRSLHDYWESLRAGRPVPYRAEVDPRDMACNARNLFILEDLGGGNLRFRLAGTALVEAFGMELRGMSARTLMEGRARESFAALIEETLAEPGIGYARLSSVIGGGETWEILLLPLRSDFGAVDRVLGALVPVSGKPAPAGDERLRFRIEDMTIRPVRDAAPEAAPFRAPVPVAGFAEGGQQAFAGPRPVGGPGRLTAIEGGRSEAENPPAPRRLPRTHLRVVKDD